MTRHVAPLLLSQGRSGFGPLVRDAWNTRDNRDVRIGILGPLEVWDSGRSIEVGGARLRALLILLALEAGRVVSAERLIDDLWEDNPPVSATNALQALISRLRTLVGRHLIDSHPAGYRLAVVSTDVDAHDFEARLAQARRHGDPGRRAAGLRDALALWRGPALADVAGAPFAGGPVARLEGLRLRATEERIEADLELGRHAELIPELEALTAADPLRESLRGRLMRALYAAGRQADALAVYEDAKEALADALGVDPSRELEQIYLGVLRHELAGADGADDADDAGAGGTPGTRGRPLSARPGGQARDSGGREGRARRAGRAESSAPGGSGANGGSGGSGRSQAVARAASRALPFDEPTTNLPAQLTSFIGRDSDLTRVGKLLDEARLVTLTGPGGAGKTRLSLESGARLAERMPDGVWFVELAPVVDPAEVPHTVLAVLGLREVAVLASTRGRMPAPGEFTEPLDRLTAALAGKRMLLLLDNCEHLVDAAARLAARLLADCPGIRILATSREPLGITGETLWPVEPLELPPPEVTVVEATSYPAVRLLADRAGAARPGFTVTDENVPYVVRICRALDGMPLAIELAAARLRVLPPDQVADRLADRFRLLTRGSRAALPRHQTLRAVVDWSWDLLNEAERTLWCTLSAFAGGATLEALEVVCELPSDDVFDVLIALVDKSLVIASDDGRYRMLETIRAYGLERLSESGADEGVRRAHVRYFLGLAEAAEPELRRREQVRWLTRLKAEHDNLHAALRWAIDAGEGAVAVRMCAALGWYWWLRGHRAEGADAAVATLAMPDLPDDGFTAEVYAMAALTSVGTSRDMDQIKSWLNRAQEIRERTGQIGRYPVLCMLDAFIDLFSMGNDRVALDKLKRLSRDEDPWLRAFAHQMHAQVDINLGRADSAARHLQLALDGFRELGERWGTAYTLTAQAEITAWRGEHERSVALHEESMALLGEIGTIDAAPHVSIRLAHELWVLGEYERADQLIDGVARSAERSGEPEILAWVHIMLGDFARRRGRLDEARLRFDRAGELSANLTGPPHMPALIAAGQGHLAAELGDLEASRRWRAEALRRAVSTQDGPVMAVALNGFADLAWRRGDAPGAVELVGAADRLRGMPDRSMPDVVRLTEKLAEALGAAAYAAAYERGGGLTLDDVLARLGIDRPPPYRI
jgi:predicted ATPase/DNA-binding SARP family transcriptional activator